MSLLTTYHKTDRVRHVAPGYTVTIIRKDSLIRTSRMVNNWLALYWAMTLLRLSCELQLMFMTHVLMLVGTYAAALGDCGWAGPG